MYTQVVYSSSDCKWMGGEYISQAGYNSGDGFECRRTDCTLGLCILVVVVVSGGKRCVNSGRVQ